MQLNFLGCDHALRPWKRRKCAVRCRRFQFSTLFRYLGLFWGIWQNHGKHGINHLFWYLTNNDRHLFWSNIFDCYKFRHCIVYFLNLGFCGKSRKKLMFLALFSQKFVNCCKFRLFRVRHFLGLGVVGKPASIYSCISNNLAGTRIYF